MNDTKSKPDYLAMVFVVLFFLFFMLVQLGKEKGVVSSFFVSAFATFMLGLPLYFGIKSLLEYCGSVVSESGVFRRHFPFYLMLLGAILGIAYFNSNKPTYYPTIPTPGSRPVHVDSYYRSDGTHVAGHDRAPPGEKTAYDRIDSYRTDSWMRRMDVVIAERNKVRLQAWLIFIGFAGTGSAILWRRHKLS